TSDNSAQVAQFLKALMPDRAAEAGRLPSIAASLFKQGHTFAEFFTNEVLLKPVPTIPRDRVDATAASIMKSVRGGFDSFGTALDTSLARRGAIEKTRSRYLYALYVIGAFFIFGAMIIVAQVIARRDRLALRRAKEESARLSAELARQQAEEALRLSEAQFRTVFDGATIGIAIVDRRGAIVDANEVFRTMFEESHDSALEGHETEFAEVFAGTRETFEFEQHIRSTIGREIWADVTVSIVHGPEGDPHFAICMFRDKTELKHSERRLLHDKTHDALTGLPNRQLFEEHLRRRFAEASALLDSFFAVVFVDLEHFKDVNESLGHAAGDLALTQIAQRMRGSVDARDVVGRLGSDEFSILVQSLGDILHVESVARRILNNVSKPISIGGKSIYLGASIGIAIGSSNYERAEDVMRDAEIALQHAKNAGGTRYALFDSKMHSRAQKRLQLTTDLRLAIERNEFRLLYQPVVGINDGRLVGCEALIRWDHPLEGELNPTEFIPLAEQTGLAAPIGRFVIRTAAEQLGAWRRNRGGQMDFMMHVNVSAAEVTDTDFERNLAQVVEQHGLSPNDFTIEITENVVLDAGTRANVVLERVRERGFKICIDDFGTGYSSLRYLQQFKVDAIKIDRSFVSGTDGELASEPIVRTLMTLAEAFDVNVVAEGVETPRQRDMLRNAGCRFAQGYMYARPLSAADMVALYPEVLARAARSA
ncbi:MAG: EAL domain-containing protein, partial [Candidatus Eremiobacteraeota bacterium]|nr:EAL domain-containing protein [Candidatus Eremiobacteraeota bacterium]